MFRIITTAFFVCLIFSIGTLNTSEPVFRVDTGASELLAYCKQGQGADGIRYSEGFCTGFILAAAFSINDWCVDQALNQGQLENLVIAELQLLETQNTSAVDAVKKIISRRWPCD